MKKILIGALLLIIAAPSFSQKIKISEMPRSTDLSTAADLPIVQGGVNKKIALDSLLRRLVPGKLLYIDVTDDGKQRLNVDSARLEQLFADGSPGVATLQTAYANSLSIGDNPVINFGDNPSNFTVGASNGLSITNSNNGTGINVVTNSALPAAQFSNNGAGPAMQTVNTTGGLAGYLETLGNNASGVLPALKIQRSDFNAGANGIGVTLDFDIVTSFSSAQNSNRIKSIWTTAANNTRTSELSFLGRLNSVEAPKFILKGSGIVNIPTAPPDFADNAAALAGSLVAGDIYRTGDVLKIVH